MISYLQRSGQSLKLVFEALELIEQLAIVARLRGFCTSVLFLQEMNPLHKLVVVPDQINFLNSPKNLVHAILPLFLLVFAVGALEFLEFILEAVNHDILLVELEHKCLIVLSQLVVLFVAGGELLVFLVDGFFYFKVVMAQLLQFG